MNILLLSANQTPVQKILEKYGDGVVLWSDTIDLALLDRLKVDFIVSHGYRHIVKKDIINYMEDKIVNLHISYLPWNRGADPNLWSFLEDTPKGVSIHSIDEGIDTGDLITQKEIGPFASSETLATTYKRLQQEIVELFRETWGTIRMGEYSRKKQVGCGSIHKAADKKRYQHLLVNGWNTKVSSLIGKGNM